MQRHRLPGERVFTVLLAAFSVFMLWQAWLISRFESITLAGSFPMAAAFVLLVSGLIVAVQTVRATHVNDDAGTSIGRRFMRRLTPDVLLAFVFLTLLYLMALEPLGFLLASFVFLLVAMRVLGYPGWLVNLLVAAVATGVIHVVFQTAFSVVLPKGTLLARLFT